MKTLLISTLVSWVVLIPAVQAQPTSPAIKNTGSKTEGEIRTFLTEQKATTVDKKTLARFVERNVADPFVYTDENGSSITTKAQILISIQTMSNAVHEVLNFDSLRVADFGTTAVATYIRTSVSDFNGQILTQKYRQTDTFVKRNGGWQHVAAHRSGIPADRPVATVDPKLLDVYSGQYDIAPDFRVTVTREGNKLMGQWPGTPKVELLPQTETTFFTKTLPGSIVFVKGETNQTSHVIYRQANGDELKGKKVQ